MLYITIQSFLNIDISNWGPQTRGETCEDTISDHKSELPTN